MCTTRQSFGSRPYPKGDRELISPDAIKTLPREDISHFDIGMPSDLLRRIEVLDTPGFADPFHDPERTLDVIESADFCIWCTLATQAWRQSERQIWLSMPARLRTNGILVVTHTDTLAHRREQQRVRTRLKREAGDLFGDIVLVAVPDAMRAMQADGRIADPDLWRASGGAALVTALQEAAVNCRKAHGEKRGAGLDETGEDAPWTKIGPGSAQIDSTTPKLRAQTSTSTVAAPASTSTVLAQESASTIPAQASTSTAEASTDAAPTRGASEIVPDPAEAAELQPFLARVMETVPACLAAAWIDLAGRKVLQLRWPDTDQTAEAATLGEAITELFQGGNVPRIEELFRRSRGLTDSERRYFQEIVIITEDCVGILLRVRSRVDRVLVVVSDRTVNLGMVLARARSLVEATDLPV
jgi:hypothetical protein